MRILLDTQCWLWWFAAPSRLRPKDRALIAEPRNEILLSAASCWEMAIKTALGKLILPEPIEEFVPKRISSQGMRVLPVLMEHALRVASLPPHHSDPFDRLLVAQAQVEDIPILTADRQLAKYEIKVILAGR